MLRRIYLPLILLWGINTMADNQYIQMELKDGTVMIQLRDDLAPKHVKRIKELVNEGFYNGLKFHRVIDKFMAQGGDPTGTGTGGSGQNITAEFSPTAKHTRGTVSMARSQNKDSADSQFFICFEDAQWLDGQYTIWGQVVSGMEHVDGIKKGDPTTGLVIDPDVIKTMSVVTQPDTQTEQPS